tara:strand:+ start:750 stop:1619 length:870 start_codon:yes stop_codon:yes gene_type:complete
MNLLGTHVVFVSGLSGGGKSTAMAALEDLSYYCVDNLPPLLVEQFLDLCGKSTPPLAKIALAVDAREDLFIAEFPVLLDRLRSSGARVELICLDCTTDELINRYRETRRVHPLSPTGSVEEGVQKEREILHEVFQRADFMVDTSELNVHQLKETVTKFVFEGVRGTTVNLISFGFRKTVPISAELLFDVRFLPNPYYEPELRTLTGKDQPVTDFVLRNELAAEFLEKLQDMLGFLLPLYEREGKAYLTIGIGCTGGRHRSVAIVNRVRDLLKSEGREVNVAHRDVGDLG